MQKNENNNIDSLIILNQISRLPIEGIELIRDYLGSFGRLLESDAIEALAKVENPLARRISKRIPDILEKFDIEEERILLEKLKVKIIPYYDDEYPPLLREIPYPPIILYKKGVGKINDNKMISVVGSRNPSFYGKKIAFEISRDLSNKGYAVVSGLAKGVDKNAHSGALKGTGQTVGVLGCGLSHIYPKENALLYEEMIENGALISEFPMNQPPLAYQFPIRNRIIAGMSFGVLVVEASCRSGSLITSKLALEFGREVMSVPGRVDYLGSRGTNRLIKSGAYLIESVEDIQNIFEQYFPKVNDKNDLSCEERSFLDGLPNNRSFLLEEIPFSLPVNELMQKISALEIQGKLQRLSGGRLKKIS